MGGKPRARKRYRNACLFCQPQWIHLQSGIRGSAAGGGRIVKSGSNLEKVLEAGHFAVTAEIGPPKGGSARVIEAHGEEIGHAADAFNVTDHQTGVGRLCRLASG